MRSFNTKPDLKVYCHIALTPRQHHRWLKCMLRSYLQISRFRNFPQAEECFLERISVEHFKFIALTLSMNILLTSDQYLCPMSIVDSKVQCRFILGLLGIASEDFIPQDLWQSRNK